MKLLTTVGAIMVFISYTTAVALERREARLDPKNCPGGKDAFKPLDVEFEAARKIISYARGRLTADDKFANAFFGPERLTGSTFETIKTRFKTMAKLVTDKSGVNIDVVCSKRCGKKTNAFMKSSLFGETMVLCPPFWELPTMADVIEECKQQDITMQDLKESQARVLVHELVHSKKVANPVITDHVYEVANLLLLAQGRYVKTDSKGKKTTLAANLVTRNAESYALTLTGIWAEAKCKTFRADAEVAIIDGDGSQQEESETESEAEG